MRYLMGGMFSFKIEQISQQGCRKRDALKLEDP
jgi:hypothetical protein